MNCELSELESLCEDVLEDEANTGDDNNANDDGPISRMKRDLLSSTTPSSISESSVRKLIPSQYPRYRNFKHLNTPGSHIRQRVYNKSRTKSRWTLFRKKRRRRRRSRVKILFKMIGKTMNKLL